MVEMWGLAAHDGKNKEVGKEKGRITFKWDKLKYSDTLKYYWKQTFGPISFCNHTYAFPSSSYFKSVGGK